MVEGMEVMGTPDTDRVEVMDFWSGIETGT